MLNIRAMCTEAKADQVKLSRGLRYTSFSVSFCVVPEMADCVLRVNAPVGRKHQLVL